MIEDRINALNYNEWLKLHSAIDNEKEQWNYHQYLRTYFLAAGYKEEELNNVINNFFHK